jgi:general transcription factor 3C polypeptide 3 (transcription factor C subunit 4)
MDPLRFAEEDETGKLPYEQFQRLEYEALAARKRKTLASRRDVESVQAKKAKQQDIFGASVDEIWDSAGFGPRRRRRKEPKKRGRKKNVPGASRLSPEVTRKLGEANLFYATGRFDEVPLTLKSFCKLFCESISIFSSVSDLSFVLLISLLFQSLTFMVMARQSSY